jgi:hypothetical protein
MKEAALTRREILALAAAALAAQADTPALSSEHPRVLITPALVKEMSAKANGPFAEEYRNLLASANAGPRGLDRPSSLPSGFMEAGLAFLIERELGRDAAPYAGRVLEIWRQPDWQKKGLAHHFGWQGLLYDWIYDAMTPEERGKFGELLAEWVATWWKGPHLDMEREGWWYNQHWGPAHLDEANHRVALLSKLFIDLAVQGNGGRFEDAVRTNLSEFYTRFKDEGLPALDIMGGIWSESNGHGGYGPTYTVPLGYQTVQAALGFDPFAASQPHGFAREYLRACIYSLTPHNDKLAYIDDSSGGRPVQFARAAPIFARHYRDGVACWLSDRALAEGWLQSSIQPQGEVWQRIAWMPADLKPIAPREAGYPLAYHFRGAGHVYMRNAWDDPNATWAFFGAGPSYAGHSRDDEGHFLICRRGQVVNRSGGQGHNDDSYYTGGSLCFNIATVYHPDERMIRTQHNENDGGMIRHVYEHPFPMDRGKITAYTHDENFTYAAADLTRAYWGGKALEVSRQFLYLRGPRECFVIFDRVEATRPDLPKHWMLHLPTEPMLTGRLTVKVADHVIESDGDTATWLSDPAGDTDLVSQGRTRAVLRRMAPAGAVTTKRGGPGHDFWGHPDNPSAQYNHTLDIQGKENPAYHRPPFSPWRLEVRAPRGPLREYFLHVLWLTDENSTELPAAERIVEPERLGVRLELGDRTVIALFDTTGPLGGHLTLRRGRRTLHDAAWPVKLAAG